MRKLHGTWLLVCVLLIAMPAVAAQGVRKGREATKGKATAAAPKAGVLARVGNETITEAEVDEVLSRMPIRGRPVDAKRRVVNHIIELYVFANEARKAGMLDDPVVKKRLEEATKLVLARGFREKCLRRKPVVSDEAARKAYEERKANLLVPEQLNLQRILVKDKAKADELLARLKKGESFEELAKKESQDPMSAARGGNLSWQSATSFPPDFREAAMALRTGELSEPIKAYNGYYIVKLLGKKDKRQLAFEEVKNALKESLALQEQKRLREEYLKKADVQIFLPEELPPPPNGQAPDDEVRPGDGQ